MKEKYSDLTYYTEKQNLSSLTRACAINSALTITYHWLSLPARPHDFSKPSWYLVSLDSLRE